MSIAEKLTTIAENEQKVYDAGKEAELKKVWDVFQQNGNRTAYVSAFYGGNFTNETFYPTHNIVCAGDANKAFYNFSYGEPFSLTQRLKDCGVYLDTSQANLISNMFAWSSMLTEIPTIDLRGLTSRNITRATALFNRCTNLITIEKLILEEDIIIQDWFVNDYALENITIDGTIGQNGFDIHYSTKLSKGSLVSIINACKKDVTASPITIKLPEMCIDGATDTEALLESLGEAEYIEPTFGKQTIQLHHTNITPNSVSIIPLDANGEPSGYDLIDNGEGLIINPWYPEQTQRFGTINYETGVIEFDEPILSDVWVQSKILYNAVNPYDIATDIKGYNIAFE